MGQSITVTVVFERVPTRGELTEFVPYCRDACRLPTHVADFENRLDPDVHADAAIADALLTTDRPRYRLDIGYGASRLDASGSVRHRPGVPSCSRTEPRSWWCGKRRRYIRTSSTRSRTSPNTSASSETRNATVRRGRIATRRVVR